MIGLGKSDGNPLPRQNMREQRMSGAIKLRDRDDVAAQFCNVDYRIMRCRLTRSDAERFKATFELGDTTFEYCVRRIAYSAVTKPFDLEIKQRGSVISAVKSVRDSLIDRHSYRFRCRVNFIPAVDGNGLVSHVLTRRIIWASDSAEARALSHAMGRSLQHLKIGEFNAATAMCITCQRSISLAVYCRRL